MYKHILIPSDGSDASKNALQTGARLAKALGAKVTVMVAVEKYRTGVTSVTANASDSPVHQAAREAAEHWLGQAHAVVVAEGIDAQKSVSEGDSVYLSILECAKLSGADLIVMGTHGAGVLERLLIGSQTQRVLAHSNLPVLVVH